MWLSPSGLVWRRRGFIAPRHFLPSRVGFEVVGDALDDVLVPDVDVRRAVRIPVTEVPGLIAGEPVVVAGVSRPAAKPSDAAKDQLLEWQSVVPGDAGCVSSCSPDRAGVPQRCAADGGEGQRDA